MVTGVISLLVGATVLFSTAMYLRNTKSNRISPARRIIKRRPRHPEPPWSFRMPIFRDAGPSGKFLADDPEGVGGVRVAGGPRAKPQPPNAPPPPPMAPAAAGPTTRTSERPRVLPTISGVLASRSFKKPKSSSSHNRKETMSSALVSELKLRLEQKINESNQGYC